ncbi:MAG: TonB-dependent receptor plug domain-containing protein [Saccharospirillaceae bacterium]|nr:TonB-dependent receptor plug domain-containing protein [Pseudomonadales bacterium]NRB80810.1 TonB-dependent receptor plug domain-containing protein [Saccharospirillaceae bacterium]
MKRLCLSLLLVFVSTNVLSEITDEWLDDEVLFDEQEVDAESELVIENSNLENAKSDNDKNKNVESIQNNKKDVKTQTTNDSLNTQNNSNSEIEETNTQQKQSNTQQLENVVINGELDKTTMTKDTAKLFSMPGAAGDPLKALQALPGINSEFSFVGAPSVRGSAPEDNSYLVDGLPVPNLYHLLGYSIFSDNIVQNFDIQMGAFPAKYAKGTGAAIYVDLRQPKNEKLSWSLDLGMFHSGFFVESRINDTQSIYFGARKSTISFFAPLIIKDDTPEPQEGEPPAIVISEFPNSDDVYFKYHNQLNNKNQISFVVIGAQDYFGIEFPPESEVEAVEPAIIGTLAVNNKQSTTGLSWDYKKDNHNQFKTTLGHIYYKSKFIIGDGLYNNLDIHSFILKTNYLNTNIKDHSLSFGAEIQNDNAIYDSRLLNNPCSRLDPGCSFSAGVIIQTGDDMAINYLDSYIQDEWFVNDKLVWTNGLHVSYDDFIQDTIWQPRTRLEYNWYDEWIFNAAFGVHHQFPEITNLLPDFGNPNLKNITAAHYTLGVEKNTYSGLKIKTDTYYKKINDVVVATNDERLYSNQANGDAYGLEVLIEQEKIGDFSGFMALSLSKSTRTNEITDETALFELDKPFVFDWVVEYKPNERWKIGVKWNLKSGNLYTPIVGSKPFVDYPDAFEPIYGELNSKRTPMQHNMDVRIEYTKKTTKKTITYYVDILNAYNHKNVEGYSYNEDYSEIEEEMGGVPLLPLLGMKMSF